MSDFGLNKIKKNTIYVLRGQVVFVDGKLLAEPGYGQDLRKISSGASLKKSGERVRIRSGSRSEAIIDLSVR